MRISRVVVKNFRSISKAEFGLTPYSVFVGPNNCGKSNLLKAIEWALTPSREVGSKDYPTGQLLFKQPIEVELQFDQLTKLEVGNFQAHLRHDESLTIRRFAGRRAISPDDEGYCSVSEDNSESRLPGELLKPGKLPDAYFVPALFNLADELNSVGNSHLGKIVGHLLSRVPHRIGIEYQPGWSPPNLLDVWRFREIETQLNADLRDFGGSVDITGPEIAQPSAAALGVNLVIDDGAKTAPAQKGHGIQRALLFALLRQWIRLQAEPPILGLPATAAESTVLLIEEPELNIHPHGVRKIAKDLNTLAGLANQQVLLCTHSPHFVDLANAEAITLVHKTTAEEGTKTRQCGSPLAAGADAELKRKQFNAATYFNPDRSELFFAEKIILVEGPTEKKILPYLALLLDCHRQGVSVIDCDGKFNLRLFMEVLNAFKLPYAVLHDLDPLPAKPGPGHRRVFGENERIKAIAGTNPVFTSDPFFEKFAGVKIAPNKPYGAYEHFREKGLTAIPAKLAETVRALYT